MGGKKRSYNRFNSKDRRIILVHDINTQVRKYNIPASYLIQLMFEHISTDELEKIRNVIDLHTLMAKDT